MPYRITEKRDLNPQVYFMKIEAPLIARKVEPGQFVIVRLDEYAERVPFTVADFDHMTVSVRVGESNIGQVSEGQKCRVTVSSAGATFDSVIDQIDHVTYTGNNVAYYTTTVKVDTSETEGIWPGMQATVTVPLEEAQNVTVLKMEGLSTARDNTAYVYKEDENGGMVQIPVTVGVSNGNYVEIREGIASGETVYKIAEKEEEATGLAALFSGLFTNQRVNRNNSWNRNRNGRRTVILFNMFEFENHSHPPSPNSVSSSCSASNGSSMSIGASKSIGSSPSIPVSSA